MGTLGRKDLIVTRERRRITEFCQGHYMDHVKLSSIIVESYTYIPA